MNWQAVTAIATVIIAIILAGAVWTFVATLRRWMAVTDVVENFIRMLDRDARPAIETAKNLINESQRVALKLESEVKGIVGTSSDIRDRITGAVDRIEDRLIDLDTLVGVVQEELEETVLDVGAALRTTRRGGAILGSMRRALFRKSSRKRRRR